MDNDENSSRTNDDNDETSNHKANIKYPQHLFEKMGENEMLIAIQSYKGGASSRGTTEVGSMCYSEDVEMEMRSASKNNVVVMDSGKIRDDTKEGSAVYFYRIVYKGVVALMTKTSDARFQKRGSYVSYGEIIISSRSIEVPINAESFEKTKIDPELKESSKLLSSTKKFVDDCSNPTDIVNVVHVDKILTGGYAVDASSIETMHPSERTDIEENESEQYLDGLYKGKYHETPKRSNINTDIEINDTERSSHHGSLISTSSSQTSIFAAIKSTSTSSLAIQNEDSSQARDMLKIHMDENENQSNNQKRYLFESWNGKQILQKVEPPLTCEYGNFAYAVCSKTPLHFLVGPCEDAPETKALALPDTILQFSLRIKPASGGNHGPTFLRLSHKRGWLPDKKVIKLANQTHHVTQILREVNPQIPPSVLNHSVEYTYASNARSRRKRRPPRRVILERIQQSSRRNNSSFEHVHTRSDTISSITTSHLDSISSPANKSMLSDDSFVSSTTKHPDLDISTTNSQSNSTLDMNNNNVQAPPSFFLMRVYAPNGLRILDAPHFQVNKLIHGQSNHNSYIPGSPVSSTASSSKPSSSSTTTSIFQNITSSYSNHNNHESSSQKTSTIAYEPVRTRTLARGTIFEASKRMETAGVYTPGAALIKLSDNSGWAIIPHQDELIRQFQRQQHHYSGKGSKREPIQAVEEIGNAITNSNASNSSSLSYSNHNATTVWLRIFPRAGIYVTCPPPPPLPPPPSHSRGETDDSLSSHSPGSSVVGSAVTESHSNTPLYGKKNGAQIHPGIEDGVASSLAGSTSTTTTTNMFFRTPRKDHFIARPHVDHSNASKASLRPHHFNKSAVLSCGMCVEVEPWEVPQPSSLQSNVRCSQSFARLSGGQGWIPRQINGELFSFKIDPPQIQHGSFWFRVTTKRGIKVRQGPSRRASSIQSEKGQSFRFECGEFLRASQVITIFGSPDTSSHHASSDVNPYANEQIPFSECFAKLYRNSKHRNQVIPQHNGIPSSFSSSMTTSSISSSSSYRSLSELATPGEWVQVHINQKYYLRECPDPPTIARHFDGWRYQVLKDTLIRKGPSFEAEDGTKKNLLKAGESIWVNERVRGFQETVTWLRLKDGRGWVHDIDEERNELILISEGNAFSNRYSKRMLVKDDADNVSTAASSTTYNSIMSRLFNSDQNESGDHKTHR